MRIRGRMFIARHGETVFNAAARLQGEVAHTPLTRAGFAQADAMGAALLDALGPKPALTMWASPTGRTLQTLAVIAEHLALDWHGASTDARLSEIGMGEWGGCYYHEVAGTAGPIVDRATGLFSRQAPGGEWYDDIARRLQGWIDDLGDDASDRLVVMHGISSRVLRGMLTGGNARPEWRAPVAAGIAQGTVVVIEDGRETVLHAGVGVAPV